MSGVVDEVNNGSPPGSGKSLSAFQGMSEAELHRILVDFNDTRVDYPRDICLHELFEAQVSRTPDAVAVVFEDRELTYSGLNHRANQLAHYLQEHGVAPESLVGVFMERSLEMVVALYGVLKAGGAYVAFDPEYPKDRLAFMLEDTQVQVLLTQKHLQDALPALRASTICLDTGWSEIDGYAVGNSHSGAAPGNLAYVLYTSGSTGKPKGVMNCHSGICNRLLWMQDVYHLTEADRVVQKTPFSFDVSVWEFFWPLICGATLVLARPGGHRDSRYLAQLISDQAITTIHFVPSMLRLFLDAKIGSECRSLKRVFCSGETLSYELQQRFFSLFDAQLYNLYGPTEAAVDVTHWTCQRGSRLGFVPIGRPVANTQLYILGDDLTPLPIGEPGELHIGGVQVGRGYLNRPELTAERFIRNPFTDQRDARLYKTGDRASYLEDGVIKYLGRIDDQVKVRGNRVELGEIQSVLEGHPAVRQAVVSASEDDGGEIRLTAYVVLIPQRKANTTELRRHLGQSLPDYMIPSGFVFLKAMPLLPNGKTDRRALPEPSHRRPELEGQYTAPRTPLERYLVDLWCDILELDCVGVHDRFFELGGTSLAAARFINRLQEELAENIYIVSIFEAPTIAQYAAFLEREYRDRVTTKLRIEPCRDTDRSRAATLRPVEHQIDEDVIARMRQCIYTLPRTVETADRDEPRNPSALFILAPPRSGTTLLRVMLAGHPDLFAASELQLLGFNTLAERRQAYTGKYSLWLEGTIRAIMEIRSCDAEQATQIMEEFENHNYTTKQLYRVLQDWIGGRMLVDKSPSYVLDLRTLERAERDFQDPLYIHLVRHPAATVGSFESYHMDQVLYLREQAFSSRLLGELVWLISHRNAVEFLGQLPKHRQYQVRFEELVREPKRIMEDLCSRFRLPFHPDLLNPYKDVDRKMVDGIHTESKPMGDTKFLEYGEIKAGAADAWRDLSDGAHLSAITWQLASELGYQPPDSARGRIGELPRRATRPVRPSHQGLAELRRRRTRRLREEP